MWRVSRATNVDWESASPGPCAAGDSAEGAASATPREPPRCIYIGDTGDNDAERASRAIYRVPEPAAARAGFTGDVASEKLTYRYADGPHDVEAMYVGPDGAMYFITKRSLKDGAGQRRPALVFRIPASAWRDTTRAVAELVDSLPIIPGSAPFRTITDASLAPDARYLAVRTYLQVYVFATDTATGRAFLHAAGCLQHHRARRHLGRRHHLVRQHAPAAAHERRTTRADARDHLPTAAVTRRTFEARCRPLTG